MGRFVSGGASCIGRGHRDGWLEEGGGWKEVAVVKPLKFERGRGKDERDGVVLGGGVGMDGDRWAY
jgi:hypothetical protein